MTSAVVIGGGIVVASAAYHPARNGFATALIDRTDRGSATRVGAGIVAPGTAGPFSPATIDFTKHAVRYFPPLLAALAEIGTSDPLYRKTGKLMIQLSDAEDRRLEAIMAMLVQRRADGMPNLGALTWKSAEQARALFPPLGPIQRAIHVADAARVDGDALRLALVQAARHHAASVVTGNAALAIDNDRVTGVVLDGRHVSADVVVVATGSWINELLAPLSMSMPIAPHRGQIIHLSLGQTDTSE